jgi:mono/diheme cytochrome c family protein
MDRKPQRDPRRRLVAMALIALGLVGLVGLTIFAIANYVRMADSTSAVARTAPAEPAGPVHKLDIAKVYNTNCAFCHGMDGTGDKFRKGMPTIPNFTSPAWQMSHTDVEMTHEIREGNPPWMPVFQDKLSKKQILGLTVYIRGFASHATTPTKAKPEKPEKPGPVPVASHMSPVQIYRAYCLACHDADGRGETVRKAMPEIPDFTNPKWQELQTNAYLRHVIRDGSGKLMPAMKDKLNDKEVGEMVTFVRGFSKGKQVVSMEPQKHPTPPKPAHPAIVPGSKTPTPSSGPKEPSAKVAARLRVATGLYRQYCMSCHGPEGRGTPMRASMPAIPDFTDRAWQEAHSDPELLTSILDGKGTFMPAFQGRLSTEQARDLIAHIRAFGPPETKVAEAPGSSDFEKHFQRLQRQWDELDRQLHALSKKHPPER